MSPAVALVSARAARGLDDDMPPLLAAFALMAAAALLLYATAITLMNRGTGIRD